MTHKMQNNIDPEVEFPKVERMLYNLAWKFSPNPQVFEEMRSVAFMGFMKACRNYREGKKTKFSSWCYFVTWGVLKSHTMHSAKENKYLTFVELNDEILEVEELPVFSTRCSRLSESFNPRQSLPEIFCSLFSDFPNEFVELTSGLSQPGQEMMALFLEAAEEVINLPREEQVEFVKKKVARKYTPDLANHAFKEICGSIRHTLA